eukprot:13316427-Alexandrium_andersonii.AAC.1
MTAPPTAARRGARPSPELTSAAATAGTAGRGRKYARPFSWSLEVVTETSPSPGTTLSCRRSA